MSSKAQKDTSRSRGPNFTREERELFVKVIEPFAHILDSKKSGFVKVIDKQRTWQKVTEIFNANTSDCPRTTRNLLSCFRNMKSKVKKRHSAAKMLVKDPSKREALVSAIEGKGKDWPSVSKESNLSMEVCQMGFEELKKEVKKTETNHKEKIMGTGGGPHEPSDDDTLNRIKKIIEPQIDGLFTTYDGDSELMQQYQDSVDESERIQPIESDFIYKNDLGPEFVAEEASTPEMEIIANDGENCKLYETPARINRSDVLKKKLSTALKPLAFVAEEVSTPEMEIIENDGEKYKLYETPTIRNRTDVLKKKISTALNVGKKEKFERGKKMNANDSFIRLSEEKLELVKLHLEVAAEELRERKLNVQLKELEIKQKEMELKAMYKEKKYKEEMQEKELLLMDLKIKKFSSE